MSPRASAATLPRSQRKQNLLLASRLARGQAVGAFDELADSADEVAFRVRRVRLWLSNPLLWMAGSAASAFVVGVALRRDPRGRALRWAWLAWQFWRRAAPLLTTVRPYVGSGARR